MKLKLLSFFSLLSICSMAFASSEVVFPVNNQEIKSYPGKVSFVLNAADGVHDYISYTLTCHISNPAQFSVPVQVTYDLHLGCPSMGGCGSITLNGKHSTSMLNIQPGENTFIKTGLMTVDYHPNTKMIFNNYDNTQSVVLKDCKATLEF